MCVIRVGFAFVTNSLYLMGYLMLLFSNTTARRPTGPDFRVAQNGAKDS